MKKIKPSAAFLFSAIVAAGVIIWALSLFMNVSVATQGTVHSYINSLPPIDPELSDTLPYRTYVETKRKIDLTRQLRNGTLLSGGGWTAWSLGTRSGYYCDTCTSKHVEYDIPGAKQHYLILQNWKLKQTPGLDSARFYSKKGQNYVRKTVKDDARKTETVVDVPVRFWYDDKQNSMLIRVTETVITVTTTLIILSMFVWLTCNLYALAAFLKLLLDISRGHTFTGSNVARLKVIALMLFAIPALQIIIDLLLRLIFWSYFTNDIALNTAAWKSNWPYLVGSVLFFLLYKAFKQGMELKEEYDLTV